MNDGMTEFGRGDVMPQPNDMSLIDQIEQIRARNNTHWMNLVRLAFELAPERARSIMQEIARLDGEVRRLTQELGA